MFDTPINPEHRQLFESYGLDAVQAELAKQYGGLLMSVQKPARAWVKEQKQKAKIQEEERIKTDEQRHQDTIKIARQSNCIAIAALVVSVISVFMALR